MCVRVCACVCVCVYSDAQFVLEEARALFGKRLRWMAGKITHLDLRCLQKRKLKEQISKNH